MDSRCICQEIIPTKQYQQNVIYNFDGHVCFPLFVVVVCVTCANKFDQDASRVSFYKRSKLVGWLLLLLLHGRMKVGWLVAFNRCETRQQIDCRKKRKKEKKISISFFGWTCGRYLQRMPVDDRTSRVLDHLLPVLQLPRLPVVPQHDLTDGIGRADAVVIAHSQL